MLDRTLVGLAFTLALYAGCTSSDSDPEGGGGVGAVNDGVVTVGNGGLGGNEGGGGNDGGGGGSGLPECLNTSGKTPPSGPYACGIVGCSDGSVCVESVQPEPATPIADECVIHFCASVPPACEADPTCACLAQFIDYAVSDAPTCTDAGGKLKLSGEQLWNPPWTEPLCPGVSCLESEQCWGCYGDGFHGFWEAPTYQCAATNPSVGGIQSCSERAEL